MRPRLLLAAALLAPALVPAPAAAQPTGLALVAPAGHGQQALALQGDPTGVRVKVCASTPCAADGGALLPVPDEVRPLLPRGRASLVELGSGKQVVRVELPAEANGPSAGGTWVLLLAAPLTGKGAEPSVIWSGWTNVVRGEQGEQRSTVVVEEPLGDKGSARRLLIGERRDDLALCGRPTLVAAKEVDPATLTLGRGASVQNLSTAERTNAVKLAVDRLGAGARPAAPIRLLRATAASSAAEKKLTTLTDGDPETTWSENKAGAGDGEFITLTSAIEVGIQSIDLVVRPTAEIEGGAAPRTLYLATPDRVFSLTLPEDAWKQPPGTRYGIKLPEPLHTSCLAVVLGDAFTGKPAKVDPDDAAAAKLPRVTIAEVEAHTAFDGATIEGLTGALAGGGDRSRAAAALLSRGGAPAIQAVIAGFSKLDARGQQLAEELIDGAPCSDQVPFFAARLAALGAASAPSTEAAPASTKDQAPAAIEKRARPPEGEDPARAHARDRLRRCGRASAGALAGLVREGAGETRILAADELALVAPGEAVPVLLDALSGADDRVRRDLRAALGRAAKSPHALRAFGDEVEEARFKARSETVAIDLLRAAGPSLGKINGAARAFASLAKPDASFRTRYLLQAPAAELALAGDAPAEAFLRASLRKDADPHVRARAATVAGRVPALAGELAAAAEDADPRVREAAITALIDALPASTATPPALSPALLRMLAADDWTFLRAGSARALGALPASAQIDAALATALADLSPEVRGRAIEALGAHQAKAQADAIRARADLPEELPEVRARAILALAALCDRRSIDDWTRRAERSKQPLDEVDRRLGAAAIHALGQVHPADLEARLAPLLTKDTPPMVREMARSALAAEPKCPR